MTDALLPNTAAGGRVDCIVRNLLASDLPQVLAIEAQAYAAPWSRVNFTDSLAANYLMCGVFDASRPPENASLIGYFVAMKGVEELHLLNLTVDPRFHRRGYATYLLTVLKNHAHLLGLRWIWLEVRASNLGAIALYTAYGFKVSGVRKDYYPTDLHGNPKREHATLMSYPVMPTCN